MPGLFIVFEGGEGAGKTTQAELLYARVQQQGCAVRLLSEPGTTLLGGYLRAYLKSKRPLTREAELLLFEAARAQLVSEIIRPELAQGAVIICDRFTASTVAYQGYGRGLDPAVAEEFNGFATGGLQPDLTFLLDIDPADGLGRVGGLQLPLLAEEDEDGPPPPSRFDGPETRRFEDQPLLFHHRVRQGYLKQAAARPDNRPAAHPNKLSAPTSEPSAAHPDNPSAPGNEAAAHYNGETSGPIAASAAPASEPSGGNNRWAVIDGKQTIDEIEQQIWAAVAPLLPQPPAHSIQQPAAAIPVETALLQ